MTPCFLADENLPQPSLIREGACRKSPPDKGDLGSLLETGIDRPQNER